MTGTMGGDDTKIDASQGGGGPDAGPGEFTPDAAACAGESIKAQQVPLDMFIMMDQSSSMSDPVSGGSDKWTAVTAALATFVDQPGLTDVSVGIQYFGLPAGGATCGVPFCTTDADCGAGCGPCDLSLGLGICTGYSGGGGDSCMASDYAVADVEIAPLPGVATPIKNSLNAHMPTTSTPTSAALQGAIDHAKAWGTAHPSDVAIVVLATDGDPTECDTNISDIDAIAAAGVSGTPKILTFVIGVGSSLSNLNSIAASGGTTMAFLVDTGADVNMQFLAAMNAIRGAALGCQYGIPVPPDGMMPDFGKLNVQYTPGGGGAAQIFPQVADQASCPASGDAWYYDNPSAPTQIFLCGSTCTKVSADAMGQIDVLLGCQTITIG